LPPLVAARKLTDLDGQERPEPPLAADEAATLLGFLGRAPSLRWIVLHMIEEYARHNGHADLLRESVDGLIGE
jgi:hypothetical protein